MWWEDENGRRFNRTEKEFRKRNLIETLVNQYLRPWRLSISN